jgi:uncharacterized protein YutE (UPF0331/DUF86 family)
MRREVHQLSWLSRIRKAVGFRNVLVHDYIEVDYSVVVDRLRAWATLREFVRQVAAYVTGAQPEP